MIIRQKEELRKKIKDLQLELNQLVLEDEVRHSGRILELSQKLDVIIVEYYKAINE